MISSTAQTFLHLPGFVSDCLEVLLRQLHTQLRRTFKIFAGLSIVAQGARHDAPVIIRFGELRLQLNRLTKILECRLDITSGEQRDASLVIGYGILGIQDDGLIQIFIGLLYMAKLGVRQPTMLISPGIVGRCLDGSRICGNSFRVALGEKVRIPSLQKVTARGACGLRSHRRWPCCLFTLKRGEFTAQACDFL
jgi:hypothetical protein